VSDVKVEQKQELSREEVARFVAGLASGLGDDGKVTVELGTSTLEFSVAGRVRCELEVKVDGDEIELELELKWSTADRASAGSEDDDSEDDDADDDAGQVPSVGEGAVETAVQEPAAANGKAEPAAAQDKAPASRRGARGKQKASS
jgi:amphi-Trp domain-containing protein